MNKIIEHIYTIDIFDNENDKKEDINLFPSITELKKKIIII